MADFALIPVSMHVVHPSDLQIGPPILLHVEDELQDVLRRSPNDGSAFAADNEGLAHALVLRARRGSLCEQPKVSESKRGARGHGSPNPRDIEGGRRQQFIRQRIGSQHRVDDLLVENAHLRSRD